MRSLLDAEALVAFDSECVTKVFAFCFEKLSNAEIWILNECLLSKYLLAVELVDLTNENLLNDCFWLTVCKELLTVNIVFFFNNSCIDVVT